MLIWELTEQSCEVITATATIRSITCVVKKMDENMVTTAKMARTLAAGVLTLGGLVAPTAMAAPAMADAPCASQAAAFNYYTSGTDFVVTVTNCSFYSQRLGVQVATGGVMACGTITGKGSATTRINQRPQKVVNC